MEKNRSGKKQIYSIFRKSLLANMKSYSVVLISGTFLITVIYVTTALGDYMSQMITGRSTNVIRNYTTLKSFVLTYALLFIFMFFALILYIRKRIGDYEMLEIFGIRKKYKYQFVMREFGGIVGVSLIGGTGAGFLISTLLKNLLIRVFPEMQNVQDSVIPLKTALSIGGLLFVLLFIGCTEVIFCLGIDVLLSFGRREGKGIHKHPVKAGAGCLLILLALISMNFYWGKVSKVYPMLIASIGLFLFMTSMGGLYLCRLRDNEEKYFRKITWLNDWYRRSFYHISMTFVIAVFLFNGLFYFSVLMLDNIPVKVEENYPYDLVWMANREDKQFLRELQEDYGVEIQTQTCIRVTSGDFGEHMGISASDYKAWTGRKVDLEDDEVYAVYQRDRLYKNYLGIDFDTQTPRIYIGQGRADLWLYLGIGDPVPGYLLSNSRFRLAGEDQQILTGIFKDAIGENIVIFSDAYYRLAEQRAEGADLAVMMNIPSQYSEVTKRIYQYAKGHSEVDFTSSTGENLIYEKKKLLIEDGRNKLFFAASGLINFLLLFLCGIFALLMKMECDSFEMEWKYKFYYIAGMDVKKRKSGIRKELLASGLISLVTSFVISGIFIGIELYLKDLGTGWVKKYILDYLAIGGMIVLIFLIIAVCSVRKATGKIGEGLL